MTAPLAKPLTKPLTKKIATALLSLLLAGLFFELGIWQLHRAHDVRAAEQVQPEKPIVDLTAIAAAGANLRPVAANRIVTAIGKYVQIYSAPQQRPLLANGKKSRRPVSLEVRLLQISDHRGILVVRGLEDNSLQTIGERVKVTGRLYPRQTVDTVNPANGILTRIDPALIAGQTQLQLFDGFIITKSERTSSGQAISDSHLASPQLRTGIAGYYWQHISYVVIWWLMALLALVLPWISRATQQPLPPVFTKISANG
jgi:cytochrome oxidase assembly protein ShyY1